MGSTEWGWMNFYPILKQHGESIREQYGKGSTSRNRYAG